MALPELLEPPGMPPWAAAGHAIDQVPVYADTPMRTGHARRRRVYTTAPRFVRVSKLVSPAQAQEFHEWFEGPLAVGVQTFATQVANQGPGLLWWTARFAEPYTAEATDAGSFRITARLLLTGEGSVDGPVRSGWSADIAIALEGRAGLEPPPNTWSADIAIALVTVRTWSADIAIALLSYFPSYELREDGGHELREDGGKELRD